MNRPIDSTANPLAGNQLFPCFNRLQPPRIPVYAVLQNRKRASIKLHTGMEENNIIFFPAAKVSGCVSIWRETGNAGHA